MAAKHSVATGGMHMNMTTSEAESVTVAFELLQEELRQTVDRAKNSASEAIGRGDYQKARLLIENAELTETMLSKLSELHDGWAEKNVPEEISFTAPAEESPATGPAILASGRKVQHPSPPAAARKGIPIVMRHTSYNSPAVADASARYSHGRVRMLAGSTVLTSTQKSFPEHLLRRRQILIAEGKLADESTGLLRLVEDIQFKSPSGAAQFVAGCSVSGNRDWTVEDTGETLGHWLKSMKMRPLN